MVKLNVLKLTSQDLVGATKDFANNEHEDTHECLVCKQRGPSWYFTRCNSQWICDHCKEEADEYKQETYAHYISLKGGNE